MLSLNEGPDHALGLAPLADQSMFANALGLLLLKGSLLLQYLFLFLFVVTLASLASMSTEAQLGLRIFRVVFSFGFRVDKPERFRLQLPYLRPNIFGGMCRKVPTEAILQISSKARSRFMR